jgi:hypothetical protein
VYYKPIIFPEHIKVSENSKTFILGCLKIEESARYSWDSVFNNNLFENKKILTIEIDKFEEIAAKKISTTKTVEKVMVIKEET